MRVVVSAHAHRDLDGAVAWLLERDATTAVAFLDAFDDLVARLAADDFEGPQVTLRSGRVVRSWPLPPCRLFYTRTERTLRIVRVYHQRRAPL